jgi:amidase
MDRRQLLKIGAAAGVTLTGCSQPQPATQSGAVKVRRAFDLEEATLRDLAARQASGEHTARSLAEAYLARIEEVDRRGPELRAVIEVNPDALSIADELDKERKAKGPRGLLHGAPILVKDNIDTGDRTLTSAGSLALTESPAPRDAFLIERLRAAGAVILGKTNLSEWANIRSSRSTSGWSARGGQTKNPYRLDRNPSGSSSGSGVSVSANLCAAAIGTETDGSIVSPASINGIVGIKPTLGLVSRSGVVPIAHSQDTAGPMARCVADAAALLSALTGVDPRDPATAPSQGHIAPDYTKFLDPNGLRGARLGVLRQYFGVNDRVDRVLEAALEALRKLGATLIEPVDLPRSRALNEAETEVLLTELKADLGAYLAARGSTTVKTLADVIAFNERSRDKEMPYFGQELFEKAQGKGSLDDATYRAALEMTKRMSQKEGIDAAIEKHRLDALVAPTDGLAWPTDYANGDHFTGSASTPPAMAGYPHITVPAGFVFGLPVGLSFIGKAWSEPALIRLAYSFEQATKSRKVPAFLAPGSPMPPA